MYKVVCSFFNPFLFRSYFTLGLISEGQHRLLTEARSFSLEATHHMSTIKNGQLYTIVVLNPATGRGCPAAFLFTADNSVTPIADWLCFLRERGMGLPNLCQITIDCSIVEVNAIRRIFPGLPIQWCTWHVQRAWNTNIRKLVKSQLPLSRKEQTKDSERLRKDLFVKLVKILRAPTVQERDQLLQRLSDVLLRECHFPFHPNN